MRWIFCTQQGNGIEPAVRAKYPSLITGFMKAAGCLPLETGKVVSGEF
jgi:hypothetical protein